MTISTWAAKTATQILCRLAPKNAGNSPLKSRWIHWSPEKDPGNDTFFTASTLDLLSAMIIRRQSWLISTPTVFILWNGSLFGETVLKVGGILISVVRNNFLEAGGYPFSCGLTQEVFLLNLCLLAVANCYLLSVRLPRALLFRFLRRLSFHFQFFTICRKAFLGFFPDIHRKNAGSFVCHTGFPVVWVLFPFEYNPGLFWMTLQAFCRIGNGINTLSVNDNHAPPLIWFSLRSHGAIGSNPTLPSLFSLLTEFSPHIIT